MSEDSFKCQKCGKNFDSERGLQIHEGQSHSQEKDSETRSNPGVALSMWQFGTLMFVLGLTTGIIAGAFAAGTGIGSLTGETINSDNTNSGNNNPGTVENEESSGQVVSLQNTDYPYGNLEAGIGSGDRTFGNVTFRLEGEPYIGSPDAEVTAVSFEDFECPFCKRYNEGAYPQIVDNYVRNGEVQYFYKHLPLTRLHPWAEPSALASECALNQDPETFWTFKQGFFSNQEALGNAHESGKFDESMYKWAEQTGLDTEQFRQCYDNEEEMGEVTQDSRQAGEVGAQATPTVFINDQKVEGAQPYSRFESIIEDARQ